VNFENFGHTTKNTIFRLVKLLAELSTRLKAIHIIFISGGDMLTKVSGYGSRGKE